MRFIAAKYPGMYYSKKLFRHPATRDAQLAPAKLTGGTPITADMAIELRKVIFGSAAAPPRGEWTRTPLLFGAAREVRSFLGDGRAAV